MEKLIEINDLTIDFQLEKKVLRACDNASFTIYRNEIVAIIGESGSGKSTLASGILNLVRTPGKITSGTVNYYTDENNIVDLLNLSGQEEISYRWKKIATVFQAAQNALNPVLKVKEHFIETVRVHDKKISEKDILEKAVETLGYVRLEKAILEYYPHQLSGGMKQRVLIALSLILDPEIIILDEPTTALDVVTQYYILQLLKEIQQKLGTTLVFLTHDIAVVSGIIDRVAVMYAGEIVEYGNVTEVLTDSKHPYTKGLIEAIPTLKDDVTRRKAIPGNPPNLTHDFEKCKFSERCFVYLEGDCEADKKKTEKMYALETDRHTRCYTWANDDNEVD